MKIIKFVDLVSVENYIFINKCFSSKSYSVFSHLYNLATGRHNHQTRFAKNGLLILPNCNTAKFGTKAFLHSTITSWNFFPSFVFRKAFQNIVSNKPEKVINRLFDFIIFLRNTMCFFQNTISFSNYNLMISIYTHMYICICFCMCRYIVIF